MRFVHTADWHLGRLFHGRHLTEDQAYVLDQLIELLSEAKAEALVLAGDVYDRAVPPVDAVRLLDDVLTRIARDVGIPVVAIAGNHDGPDRLAFGSALLREKGVYVVGRPSVPPSVIRLSDEHGEVCFHAAPYAEPSLIREVTGDDALGDHDLAMRAVVGSIERSADARHVLVAHAFVAGSSVTDSERPLSVGGAGTVGADAFDGFDYVALGHLHQPQQAGSEAVRYSGSLLKYSFHEAAQRKAVLVVDLDASGVATIEEVALTPRHDVRVIEGELADLLAGPKAEESREDYVLARLTDRGALFDPLGKLRQVYPNVMQVERTALEGRGGEAGKSPSHRDVGDLDLFRAFAKEVSGEDLSEAEQATLTEVLETISAREREAAS